MGATLLKLVLLLVLVSVLFEIYLIVFTKVQSVSSLMPNTESFYREQDRTVTHASINETEHSIVMYNAPHWMANVNFSFNNCTYQNCRISYEKSNLRDQSAIFFHLSSYPYLPKQPPISPSSRRHDQIWIFMWNEAPVRHTGKLGIYKTKPWINTPNWTLNWSDHADIVSKKGFVSKRIQPAKNYSEIFHRKTKMAAWVVSHCTTNSKREIYVRKLRENGIDVHIYGKCGNGRIQQEEKMKIIGSQYKFYLSFENSLCKDYITEKFYEYFNLDVVLVVRGSGNYSNLLPSNTYINTADFKSIKDIAVYLKKVATSEELYTDYLQNKDCYETHPRRQGELFCKICEKLNKLDENKKIYRNVASAIQQGACVKPTDLQ